MENDKSRIASEIIRNIIIGAAIAGAIGLFQNIVDIDHDGISAASELAQRLLDSPEVFRPDSMAAAKNTILALYALIGGASGFAFGPISPDETVA